VSGDVILHIDELVLHGFAPTDRHRIADAVVGELSRLLGEGGLPEAWSAGDRVHVQSVDAGRFEVAPGARADRIGNQIAQATYQGLDARGAPDVEVPS